MWRNLGQFILKYRFPLLFLLAAITGLMAYEGSKVELSYELTRAIPVNHPNYKAYQAFKKKFGEDGNLLVVGIQTKNFFEQNLFNAYATLYHNLKQVKGVADIISVPSAINLEKVPGEERLKAETIFPQRSLTQIEIDSCKKIFLNLPFYKARLYNLDSNVWMMGISINKNVINSEKRNTVVGDIVRFVNAFGTSNNLEVHLSGLPFIRTELSTRIADEMRWFLMVSIILSAVILLLFFRSISSMLLSLSVMIIGVLWSLGTMQLLGYKITLLTALIPPLVVVIGIPNCIYFLNKFHTSYNETGDKKKALIAMIERMGIVTLFCNLSAAIGFAVFALTRSQVLKEFGVVAGINIMALFFISLVLIPSILSFLSKPKTRHTKYLHNPRLNRWLNRLERWTLNHRKLIYIVTICIVAAGIAGIFRLKTEGFMLDDIPKSDKLYMDLKFFERNFKGVMPLEIVVDTKRKYGASRNLNNLNKIDSLSRFVASIPEMAKPLSIIEGLKFARQAFFDGDSAHYSMPSAYDLPALQQYLRFQGDSSDTKNSLAKLVTSFMDSNKQETRISVSMEDVGSRRLPYILDSINKRAIQLFGTDTSKYKVTFTGTSITFLTGSTYIINGLKESIFWAFLLIALCMLYLFRSFRILICSLIPNIIPLVITAGVMGWVGIRLKPSTVLVFSVALGIAIDVTIRFLVNFKQELPLYNHNLKQTVIATIHSTGISIIYTSFVLITGFFIFCFSGFGGTQSLGWLTSLTLVTATLTNLVLLPALLISMKHFKLNKTDHKEEEKK
ncbi:MAG: MMPL family transporter [Bacteroidetes bacterium]|nr:MMPL family transporter [Bacteroidota bacterium]MBS1632032.1 MMPL family transporter [Bacteroidota bacterium]